MDCNKKDILAILEKINSNLKIIEDETILNNSSELYIFKINRITNIDGSDSNLVCNVLISLIKGFDINDDIFSNPKLEPLGYYVYYKLCENIKKINKNRYNIKYGIENILGDMNWIKLKNENIYFKGYQDFLRVPKKEKEIKKIYLNKAKFDLFYENLLLKYSDYNTIKNKVDELEQIYKILYLIYYNESLSEYYKKKIGNILNIHKSFFRDPITHSFGSIVNLDKLKSEIMDTHSGIGKNKQLTGSIK